MESVDAAAVQPSGLATMARYHGAGDGAEGSWDKGGWDNGGWGKGGWDWPQLTDRTSGATAS